jgi:hypothetical protein
MKTPVVRKKSRVKACSVFNATNATSDVGQLGQVGSDGREWAGPFSSVGPFTGAFVDAPAIGNGLLLSMKKVTLTVKSHTCRERWLRV